MAHHLSGDTGFPRFSELPTELQIKIWEMTVEPRRVPVSCWFGDEPAPYLSPFNDEKHFERNMDRYITAATLRNKTTRPNVIYATSPLKPAILDVCQQSRAIGQRVYTALELTPRSGVSYAWLHLGIDTVYLDKPCFVAFRHCADSIRRLEFEADIGDEGWCWRWSNDVIVFDKLDHCLINTNDCWWDWWTDEGDYSYRPLCSPENLWIRLIKTGEMRSGADLDREAVRLRLEEENMARND